jgi:histidinol dehydrogenase
MMMKIITYPAPEIWESICRRPVFNQDGLQQTVSGIITNVKERGDEALKEYTQQFDRVALHDFRVTDAAIEYAVTQISDTLKTAIHTAKENIEKFHAAQTETEKIIETTKGIQCWRKSIGIEKVGLYIPGGSAPLFSTVLMLAIPAKIAGCKEIILCTPCNSSFEIHPAILYAAHITGVTVIYKIGGAQAIAAMAFGTQTVPKVYKIFGPGNQFVTKAKELVEQYGVAIDMPAGPSEVLIIATETTNPAFAAADLLAQAEHGPDSQVVLVTNNSNVVAQVNTEIEKQLACLPRKETAKRALENSFAVILKTLPECVAFSNTYAPEHLILAIEDAATYTSMVVNAGSVFLGNYSCESVGDYASGPNHTLPTNGFAKSYSGVSVDSFVKKITFQQITAEGLKNIGNTVEILAATENLAAHKNAVTIRLNTLRNDNNNTTGTK